MKRYLSPSLVIRIIKGKVRQAALVVSYLAVIGKVMSAVLQFGQGDSEGGAFVGASGKLNVAAGLLNDIFAHG